jgi:hypothetical protein
MTDSYSTRHKGWSSWALDVIAVGHPQVNRQQPPKLICLGLMKCSKQEEYENEFQSIK